MQALYNQSTPSQPGKPVDQTSGGGACLSSKGCCAKRCRSGGVVPGIGRVLAQRRRTLSEIARWVATKYALPEALQALSICERCACALALLLGHNLQKGSSLWAQATKVLDHERNKGVSSCHHWQILVVLLS